MVIRLIVSILGGLAAHQFERMTRPFGEKWSRLLRYAIGYLAVAPFRYLIKADVIQRDNSAWADIERDATADILAGVTFGLGVFLGYMMDKEDE